MLDLPSQLATAIATGADIAISMSGGKDSTATYLYLMENGVLDRVERAGGKVYRVFADTGWELDETYLYLDRLEQRIGKIHRVALWVPGPNEAEPEGYDLLVPAGKTERWGDGGVMHAERWVYARLIEARLGRYSPLVRLMCQWRKVPTAVRRWCTDDTKKRPIVEFLATLANPINVIGVRAEESADRAKHLVSEWSDDYDALVWRPIHHLKKAEVIALHTRHGITPNPLYLQGSGAGRVGCGPCVYSGAADIRWLSENHAGRLEILADLEDLLHALNLPRVAKGFEPPRWFMVNRQGKDVPIPVAEAVRLASDDLGGDAPLLFAAQRAPGCEQWGLCVW